MDGTDLPGVLGYEAARVFEDEYRAYSRAKAAWASPEASVEVPVRRRAARFGWLTRPRRILLLLGTVWVLNIFDLGYTLLEVARGSFIEMNPVAAPLLSAPPYVLVLYKAGLVVGSSTILLLLRHHRVVEVSCWFLLAAYLYVAGRWVWYYQDLLSDKFEHVVYSAPAAG